MYCLCCLLSIAIPISHTNHTKVDQPVWWFGGQPSIVMFIHEHCSTSSIGMISSIRSASSTHSSAMKHKHINGISINYANRQTSTQANKHTSTQANKQVSKQARKQAN